MRVIFHRLVPAALLAAVIALLSLNAATPSSARAVASSARLALDAGATTASTPAPGPTTAPPELSVTEGFTYTTEACLIPNATVTLGIANTGDVNTPADTTLVVNLSHLAGSTTGEAGHLTLQSITVSGNAPQQPYTVTQDGSIILPLGAIAIGAAEQVAIVLGVNPTTVTGDLGTVSAHVYEPTPPDGSGEILSNVVQNAPLQATLNCPPPTYPPAPTVTQTMTPTATSIPTTVPSATQAPADTSTSTPTSTPTATPIPPTQTTAPIVAAIVPASMTPQAAPSLTPGAAPSATAGAAPSATPVVPPSATAVVPPSATSAPMLAGVGRPKVKTIVKTVVKKIPRYQTIKRYQTVKRYQTLVRYKTLYRTVVRYKTLQRVHVVQAVRVVVNHKTVVRHVVRTVVRTVVRHRTVTSTVYAVRVMRHPTTGRFAAGFTRSPIAVEPPQEAAISIPRLRIASAPIWSRGYIDDGYGGFTYDIVPFYGVTRFSYSVPFGMAGTTIAYGHDDIKGSIFRYLGNMRPGDDIFVTVGARRLDYVVHSVSVVSPDNVSMLTAPRAHPTLALISCTPYWVDTHRVVVLASLK